jgi:hypothetical protein
VPSEEGSAGRPGLSGPKGVQTQSEWPSPPAALRGDRLGGRRGLTQSAPHEDS